MGAIAFFLAVLCSIPLVAGCVGNAGAGESPDSQRSEGEPSVKPSIGADPTESTRWRRVDGVEIATKRLFDLGVADPDFDGRLDIFAVNHKFRATFLQNRGNLRFEDRFADWGLSQVPRFPGLDSLSPPGGMTAPGVRVWMTDRQGEPGRIHLAAVGTDARLAVQVRSDASVTTSAGVDVEMSEVRRGANRFALTVPPGGTAEIAASSLGELPVRFDFSRSDLDPEEIQVGDAGASPARTRFRIQLHDRHGLAFAEVNGDRTSDVFVVSGGAGGRIERSWVNELVSDQLLLSSRRDTGIRFADRIEGSGIEKEGCRGRDAMWADFDRDGRLDLLITCENRPPTFFRGSRDGGFSSTPGPPIEAATYRWLNLDGLRPRLLAGTADGLEVWEYRRDGWLRTQILPNGRNAAQIAVGDLDEDGSLDVLALAQRKLRVYRNREGRLSEWGSMESMMPKDEVAVSVVDVDNDGWLDLSLAKHGLMLWDPVESRFVTTGELAHPRAGYAVLNWPDLDGDGRRDLLAAYSTREFSPRSDVRVERNVTTAGRWLQIALRGSRGNREGIGARVVVTPRQPRAKRAPRAITQYVGQNEGSRHSQGHYRTYFGLGGARRADVTVHWPGGGRSVRRDVRADRSLVIRR